MNYFQLFGIDHSFNVDLSNLSSRYQSLQKTVHPDKFAHASSQERLLAVHKSAQINDAYQTLKQPLKRAEYILTLRGVDLPDEQSTFNDNLFLMRQMELREMLTDIHCAEDTDAALLEAQQTLASEKQALFSALDQQINEDSPAADALACVNLRKLKFYEKLYIELERLEDSLFDD